MLALPTPNAYTLVLQRRMRCSPTVNVSLKPFFERVGGPAGQEPVADQGQEGRGRRGVARSGYLVRCQWRPGGHTYVDDEWLREEELVHCCDKVLITMQRRPVTVRATGTLATTHPSPPSPRRHCLPPRRPHQPPPPSTAAPPPLCRSSAAAPPPPAAPPLVVTPAAGFRLRTPAEIMVIIIMMPVATGLNRQVSITMKVTSQTISPVADNADIRVTVSRHSYASPAGPETGPGTTAKATQAGSCSKVGHDSTSNLNRDSGSGYPAPG